ncbi:MAG: energy-coupling factor ABC transporter ATP-binding protein [Candidatus Omnitrophota bacterium]
MITLNNVSFAYEHKTLLDSISFSMQEKERIVLLGVNGSGKSTLLKIIDALIFPTSGEYVFKGTAIRKKAFSDRNFSIQFRKTVALLFQNPEVMLFNPTVYDEIAFGLKQMGSATGIDAAVREWAEKMHVSQYLDLPPFELSGGEKQKVALAALLVLEPELLLLDEPMSNLDPRSQGLLLDLLYELPVATIISTHNLSLAAELGQRAILLSEDHRLLFDGDIQDLLQNEEMLIHANLVHIHRHRHQDHDHAHYHKHD